METVPNAHGLLAERWEEMMRVHTENDEAAVFVVPIYSPKSGMSSSTPKIERAPSSKITLTAEPRSFERSRYMSHQALNYNGWESTLVNSTFLPFHESGNPRAVLHRRQEPYFIIRKNDTPPYNVLFMGMQQDKETQVRDTNACGFIFFLHPDAFAVDFPHADLSASTGWTNLRRLNQDTWRQAFVHYTQEAYKQELHKAMMASKGNAFRCSQSRLHEVSARGWQNRSRTNGLMKDGTFFMSKAGKKQAKPRFPTSLKLNRKNKTRGD
uniref:Uncharacterized protein n=1 Tax=Odontella aurita TaxID=265563 RepID=A0A7S4JVW0_9STRA|mmetsp:Transcript_55466/g.166328  ORF Transcript_55466/g.166328 Transcript_55466/m.166328 type:complete len:268 (+) Transcript_55466:1541-2344(+)